MAKRKSSDYADYIKSELSRGRSCASIADELGFHRSNIYRFADKHGLIKARPVIGQKDRVLKLLQDGLNVASIAHLIGASPDAMHRAIKKWGLIVPEKEKVNYFNKISLNDLKSNWNDVNQPYVVTVGRIPKFYLVPISE